MMGFELQAYQVELESLAVRLEEENDRLLKEKVLHFFGLHFWNLLSQFFCFWWFHIILLTSGVDLLIICWVKISFDRVNRY